MVYRHAMHYIYCIQEKRVLVVLRHGRSLRFGLDDKIMCHFEWNEQRECNREISTIWIIIRDLSASVEMTLEGRDAFCLFYTDFVKRNDTLLCHVEPSRDIPTDCNTVVLHHMGSFDYALREGRMTR